MPYLSKIQPHTCRKPSGRLDHGRKRYGDGTTWQCPKCKKIYRLETDQRDGVIWVEQKGVINASL